MAALPRNIIFADENATIRLGEDLSLALHTGDCLALSGDLGVGKSTLARALIRCMADDEVLDVPSPTFTLVQTYELRIKLAHFDLYRISDPQELIELGLDDALLEGAALIEWPEQAGDALPADAVRIRLTEHGNGRRVEIEGPQDALDRIDRSLDIRDFLDKSGCVAARRQFLLGDASARIYETIRTSQSPMRLLMNSPRREVGPIIRNGKNYAKIAHSAEDIVPFIALDKFLQASGFRVPAVFAEDLDNGLALIEHLGDERILDHQGTPVATRWERAIDCLVELHRQDIPATIPVSKSEEHNIPPFDAEAMMVEVELFLEWYYPFRLGSAVQKADRVIFERIWSDLIDALASAETGLVLRDFHSPNILWQPGEKGIRQIGLIDFQDAMIGPVAYDVASLIQDARTTVPVELAERLVKRYELARMADIHGFDADGFRGALAIMQAQRATKILGIFVRLRDRDGKSGYLQHLPRMETYLSEALNHPVLGPLREFYTRAGIKLAES